MNSQKLVVLVGAAAAVVLLVLAAVLKNWKETDVARIQGAWKVTSASDRGRAVDVLTTAVFNGDEVTFNSSTGISRQCTYRLEAGHRPPRFDLFDPEEGHLSGIYALDDDVLRIVVNESTEERATAFEPESGVPHKLVMVLERERR